MRQSSPRALHLPPPRSGEPGRGRGRARGGGGLQAVRGACGARTLRPALRPPGAREAPGMEPASDGEASPAEGGCHAGMPAREDRRRVREESPETQMGVPPGGWAGALGHPGAGAPAPGPSHGRGDWGLGGGVHVQSSSPLPRSGGGASFPLKPGAGSAGRAQAEPHLGNPAFRGPRRPASRTDPGASAALARSLPPRGRAGPPGEDTLAECLSLAYPRHDLC